MLNVNVMQTTLRMVTVCTTSTTVHMIKLSQMVTSTWMHVTGDMVLMNTATDPYRLFRSQGFEPDAHAFSITHNQRLQGVKSGECSCHGRGPAVLQLNHINTC
jgi:hypothetical protein